MLATLTSVSVEATRGRVYAIPFSAPPTKRRREVLYGDVDCVASNQQITEVQDKCQKVLS